MNITLDDAVDISPIVQDQSQDGDDQDRLEISGPQKYMYDPLGTVIIRGKHIVVMECPEVVAAPDIPLPPGSKQRR